MKKGNTEKWTDIEGCQNLLFFSQLVNELLFDYSIPSNRISTLNSHYLCEDALNAIHGIEYKGVPEGTLKPIMEELCYELQKDLVFNDDNHPQDYFVKCQNDGNYIICNKMSDIGYADLKNIAHALNQRFFNQNNYYDLLRDQTVSIIKGNKSEERQNLFRLTKSILTELKNGGYSLRYIYMVMNNLFWEPSLTVDSVDKIDDFFAQFDFKEKKYQVVFKGEKRKIDKVVNYIDYTDIKCVNELPDELKEKTDASFFNKKSEEIFLILKDYEAFDPFEAAHKAMEFVEINASVYRFYDHTYKYRISSAKCEIFDDNHSYKIGRKLRAVEHTKLPSVKQISESMKVVDNEIRKFFHDENYRDGASLIGALRYHSHSLDSLSEENQLLDLWAIFESVLDVSNKHTSDRIQQVCMYLVPLLKQKYIYSLFWQLADDIKNYDENLYANIVGNETNESEIVRLVCEFVLLESEKKKRVKVLDGLNDFPLLKERIEYYRNVLGTKQNIHNFVEKHAKRVRWQIMRIYRNRNLIIHNGSKMPYLSLLIENLHSYVDDFISYVVHSMAEGKDINSMCQELLAKEGRWNSKFPKSNGAITAEQIKYMLSM